MSPLSGQGFALKPTRGALLPWTPRQRARPFGICPLVGWKRGAYPNLDRSRSAPLFHPTKLIGSKGPRPLAEVQEAEPPGGGLGAKPRRLAGSIACANPASKQAFGHA